MQPEWQQQMATTSDDEWGLETHLCLESLATVCFFILFFDFPLFLFLFIIVSTTCLDMSTTTTTPLLMATATATGIWDVLCLEPHIPQWHQKKAWDTSDLSWAQVKFFLLLFFYFSNYYFTYRVLPHHLRTQWQQKRAQDMSDMSWAQVSYFLLHFLLD